MFVTEDAAGHDADEPAGEQSRGDAAGVLGAARPPLGDGAAQTIAAQRHAARRNTYEETAV